MDKNKRLMLSNDDQKILGVCGGLAEYLEIDVLLIRLIFVFLVFIPPAVGIWIYLVLALILPPNPNSRKETHMEDKKLYLSNTDKKMLGVCGGIAEYLGVDSTVVRAIFAVLFFAFGTGLLAYFVLYFIMPKRNDHFISD